MKTKRCRAVMIIGLAVFLASHASAQAPPFAWAKHIAGTTNDDDELAVGLAIDSAGNLYVTGWFDGTNDFGGSILTNTPGGGQDIFVAKYTSTGTNLWARQAGSDLARRDGGRGIGVDSVGNAYVTGEFSGSANFDGSILSGSTRDNFFLAKYDSDGTIQWVRQSTGARSHYGTGIAVDGAGNCHAVGYIDDFSTVTFDGDTSLSNTNSGYGTFLVKYDSDGDAKWAQLISSPEQSYCTSVAVDGGGNVYVAGAFQVSLLIGDTNLTSAGGENGFFAKFNSTGDFLWVRQLRTSSYGGDPAVVAVDDSGGAYVAGGFGVDPGDTICFGSSLCLTNIGGGFPEGGIGDAFLVKYDGATGVPQWAVRSGGTNADAFLGVSTDSQGNVYAGGAFGGTGVPGGFYAVVAKYDMNGVRQWMQSSTGTNGALIFAKPAVDAAGNCYAAGWFQSNAVFGTTPLTGRGYWDFFVTKVGTAPLPLSLGIQWDDFEPRLNVIGDIGTRFALEYVPALATNQWQALFTNTLVTSPFILTNETRVASPTGFYRARVVP